MNALEDYLLVSLKVCAAAQIAVAVLNLFLIRIP